jgi:ATP phosphoribosyltransferase regulatory subunit HisZ
MRPIEASFKGVASTVTREHHPDTRQVDELPPTLQDTLQRMLDRPDAHAVGDLAALTERLTNEMMLFSALVGGTVTAAAAVDRTANQAECADAAQAALHAEFLRDLEV